MAAEPLDNVSIAERLDAFAVLLDLAGSERYTARAYRRAAETVRETRAPVAELVTAGRAQELRGIGPGIAARLGELVETGSIVELDQLEREVQPQLVGFGRLLGISPQRMLEIGRALDVRTPDEFRAVALAGRLRSVPGIGPKTEARILERLASGTPRARRGLVLNRARALVEGVGVVGALAVGAPVALGDVALSCLLTATAAALVVPLVVGAERGLVRRRYG